VGSASIHCAEAVQQTRSTETRRATFSSVMLALTSSTKGRAKTSCAVAGRRIICTAKTTPSGSTVRDGEDQVYRGTGADILWGGNEDDYLDGGENGDELVYELGADQLVGARGRTCCTVGMMAIPSLAVILR